MSVPAIQAIARQLANAREEAEYAEANAKGLRRIADEIERKLFDTLEDQGLRSIKLDGLGTFSMNDLAWARVTDRPAALAWAEANVPELLTLNNTRLSMLVRTALKGEGEMPAGVEWTSTRKINWRKPA